MTKPKRLAGSSSKQPWRRKLRRLKHVDWCLWPLLDLRLSGLPESIQRILWRNGMRTLGDIDGFHEDRGLDTVLSDKDTWTVFEVLETVQMITRGLLDAQRQFDSEKSRSRSPEPKLAGKVSADRRNN